MNLPYFSILFYGFLLVCTLISESTSDIYSGFITVKEIPSCAQPSLIKNNPRLYTSSLPAFKCDVVFNNDSIYSEANEIIPCNRFWKFLLTKNIDLTSNMPWRYDLQLFDSLCREYRIKADPIGYVKSIPGDTKCFFVRTRLQHLSLFVSVNSFSNEAGLPKYYVAFSDRVHNHILYKNKWQDLPDSINITIQYRTQYNRLTLTYKSQVAEIVALVKCAENPHFDMPKPMIRSYPCDYTKINYVGMTLTSSDLISDLFGKVIIDKGQVSHRLVSDFSEAVKEIPLPNPGGILETRIAEILCNSSCASFVSPNCELFPDCIYNLNKGKYWTEIGFPVRNCLPAMSYPCTTGSVKDISAMDAPWASMDNRYLFGAALGDKGFATSMVVIDRNNIIHKGKWNKVTIDISKTGSINTILAYKQDSFIIGTQKAGILKYDTWWLEKELNSLSDGLPKSSKTNEFIEITRLTKNDSIVCAHLANGNQYILDNTTEKWTKATPHVAPDDTSWNSFTCGLENFEILKVKRVCFGFAAISKSNFIFIYPERSTEKPEESTNVSTTDYPVKSIIYRNDSYRDIENFYDLRGRLITSTNKNIIKRNGVYLSVNKKRNQMHVVKKIVHIK